MGRAEKAKGTFYENKLVKLLKGEGFGSYRVPLSGALGHQKNSTLPDNLRRALSGDVGCELLSGIYVPFEVKFRGDAAGYKSLYNSMESSGSGFILTEYLDCYVFPESDLSFLHGTMPEGRVVRSKNGLTPNLHEWFVGSEVLALKATGRPWLFVIKKENHAPIRPEPSD